MKRLVIIFFSVILLVGCGANEGSISKKDKKPLHITKGEEQVFDIKTDSTDKFDILVDKFTGWRIGYPKNGEVDKGINTMVISGSDYVIYINHNLYNGPTESKELFSSMENIVSLVSIGKYSSLYLQPKQSASKMSIINDKIAYREFNNAKFKSKYGEYVSNQYSEKQYFLRDNGIDTVISLICDQSKKDQYFKMLDGMVSSITRYSVIYNSSIKISSGDFNYIFPNSFQKTELDIGKIYMPTDADYYSGCFVAILKDKNISVDEIFNYAFPNVNIRFNNGEDDNLFYENHDSYSVVGTIYSSSAPFHIGNSYIMEICEQDNNLIAVGYPASRKTAINILAKGE